MGRHVFNFDGGSDLTTMGATWFVSYLYWLHIDKEANNWERVSTRDSRRNIFNRTRKYHQFWIGQILNMDETKLNRNEIGLTALEIKRMAKEVQGKI